jgi:hypothetical protein
VPIAGTITPSKDQLDNRRDSQEWDIVKKPKEEPEEPGFGSAFGFHWKIGWKEHTFLEVNTGGYAVRKRRELALK